MGLTGRRRLGKGLWIVGALVAAGWAMSKQSTIEVRGMAQARTMLVASTEVSRVKDLPVHLHDAVQVGEILANLDDSALQDQQKVAAAQLLAIQEQLSVEVADRSRRFAQASESALLDRARLSTDLAEDAARIKTLQQELDMERGLVAQGAGAQLDVARLEWEIKVISSRMAAQRSTVNAAKDMVGGTSDRQNDLSQPLEWQVIAATRTLELVESQIDRMTLRANLEGRVTWVHHHAGDVVPAGEPILEIAEEHTRKVVGYMPAGYVGNAKVGDSAQVLRASGQTLSAEVLSVGTDVRQLPPQLQLNPAAPEWGVPIQVVVVGEQVLGPDEPVTLRL